MNVNVNINVNGLIICASIYNYRIIGENIGDESDDGV